MDRANREEAARRHVDSAESWLRKIIHHELSAALGTTYLSIEGIIKNEIRRQVDEKAKQLGGKLLRPVDATTFDQAIYLATHPDLYAKFFRSPLSGAYPLGREQALLYLTRLKDIRNAVSHGRGCTARQVEQAVCYANDLVDSLKEHFRKVGMDRIFDVPMIVRYVDNRGNESHLDGLSTDINMRILDWRTKGHGDLYPGEILIAEVEIDQSYDPSSYHVSWSVPGFARVYDTHAKIEIVNKHVGEQLSIVFDVATKRDWHRQSGVDDRLTVVYRVHPPRP
jgi:hypothetical protein